MSGQSPRATARVMLVSPNVIEHLDQSNDSTKAGRSTWALLAFSLLFCGQMVYGMVVPFLPGLGRHFHASALELSLLVSLPNFALLAVSLPAGALCDAVGAPRVAVVSGVLVGLGTAVQGWAPLLPVLLVGRLLYGIGWGAMWTAVPVSIADSSRSAHHKARNMALIATISGVGLAAGPGLGGILARLGTGVPFGLVGAVTAAVALTAARNAPRATRRRGTRTGGYRAEAWRALGRPGVRAAMLITAISSLCTNLLNLVGPLELHAHGQSSETIGVLFSVASGAVIVTSTVLLPAAPKLTTLRFVTVTFVLIGLSMAPAVAAVSVGTFFLTLLVSAIIRAGQSTIAYPLVFADGLAGNQTGSEDGAGVSLGLVNASFAVFGAIGPTVGGVVVQGGSFRVPFAVMAGAALIAAALTARLEYRARQS